MLAAGRQEGVPATIVSASDVRGYVYGLLELAERVQFGANPAQALRLAKPIEEKPANEVRCVGRYFCSELEDKPWLYDRDFWPGYLDVLAASRFNRFCLGFGLEYDFPKGVTSDYLHFPYPYLLDVPGYDVRVMQLAAPDGKVLTAPVSLSAAEREKNLQALQFIAAQTAARGSALPTRHLDARLPVDRQPQCVSPHRRVDAKRRMRPIAAMRWRCC